MRLEAIPNEPFRIPSLRLQGGYTLDNIRLVQSDEVLAFAEPSTAVVKVKKVLLTSFSSRALTLDEIRAYGLAIDNDTFQTLQLTFAFGAVGRTIEYGMPVVYYLFGPNVNWDPGEPRIILPS